MQHIFSLIAAVGSLTVPQAAITANAPIAVSTCSVTDIYGDASTVEFGPPISYRVLRLRFLDTDDAVATQVTFDVTHRGTHTTPPRP